VGPSDIDEQFVPLFLGPSEQFWGGRTVSPLWETFVSRTTVGAVSVLDLVSQVRDAILMNVYLDVGNPRGSGFWNEGYMSKGREMKSLVYKQPRNEVDGSYHSKEGSK
jgi:hypothetical protein